MEKFRNIIDKMIEIFCTAIMVIMTVLVSWQVFTRYVFNKPSTVTEQLCQYLFIWLVLFGSAFIFGKREHMQIVFIKDKLPAKLGMVCDIIQEITVFIFTLGILIVGGYQSSMRQMAQVDAALQIPIGIIYAAIPLSGIFVIFYSILNVKKIIMKK